MGGTFSNFWKSFWETGKETRFLILGLDGAGKTTILYQLQTGEVVTTVPTVGINVEKVTHKNVTFEVWDLGGQSSLRPYWRLYYQNTDAVIFVVDSSDKERMETCRQELFSMLDEEEMANAALLILANKQDIQGALTEAQVGEALGVEKIKNRPWAIHKTSAVKGIGIEESLDWLVQTINK